MIWDKISIKCEPDFSAKDRTNTGRVVEKLTII
jgi:hypothetical protein